MKILLITMPWAKTDIPSIQLGLLQSALLENHIECNTKYFNIAFSGKIGLEFYNSLCSNAGNHFIMEWLFNDFIKNDTSLVNTKKELEEETKILDELFKSEIINPYNSNESNRLSHNNQELTKEYQDAQKAKLLDIKKSIIPFFLYESLNEIDFAEFDIIGFSCTFSQTLPSLAFSRIIKRKFPEKVIVFGGGAINSEMSTEFLKTFSWVNYFVLGEGEQTLIELINQLRSNRYMLTENELPIGTVSKIDEKIVNTGQRSLMDVNDCPIPLFSDYYDQIKKYEKKYNVSFNNENIVMESSRGCWWGEKQQCTFCSLNGEHIRYRAKNVNRIIHEIQVLSFNYKINNIIMVDNIISKNKFGEIFTKIKDLGIDLSFFWEIKVDLNESQIKQLSDAGVNKVQAGIESFSSSILKLMRKGTNMLKNIQLLLNCQKHDIYVSYNILFGFPGEQASDYQKMNETLSLIFHLQPPLYPIRSVLLQRDSEYFKNPDKYGIRNIRPMSQYHFVYPLEDINHYNLSYNFSFQYDGYINSQDQIEKTSEIIREWNLKYQSKKAPILVHESGIGFIKIYDFRFEKAYSYLLEGSSSEVYKACFQISRIPKIMETNKELKTTVINSHQIDSILEKLIMKRLIVSENQQYLSLSIPIKNIARKIDIETINKINKAKFYRSYERI